MQEPDVVTIIQNDTRMMHILRIAQSLNLPDWCVCAGFVRSKVWDYLHGMAETCLPDIDVVYFDSADTDESAEKMHERNLLQLDGSIPWSVKNQARMHTKSGHIPYISTFDGIAHFPETCTAVGVYLNANGDVTIVAPYGIDDLVNLIVRPTPLFMTGHRRAIYEQRIETKQWGRTWNHLRFVHWLV